MIAHDQIEAMTKPGHHDLDDDAGLQEQLDKRKPGRIDRSNDALSDIRGIHFTIHVEKLRYPCDGARALDVRQH